MQHRLLVIRRQDDLHVALCRDIDGMSWTSLSAPTRAELIERLDASIDSDGQAFREMNVLSIDAWREGDSWTWNAWYKRGTLTVREFSKLGAHRPQVRRTLAWFREEGYLSDASKGAVELEDDGHNLVVLDRRTRKPLFAIEYGPLEYPE